MITGTRVVGSAALLMLLAGCSSGSVSLESLPGAVPSQVAQSTAQTALPEATLGAQETAYVAVILYLRSNADVAQRVSVVVSFQDNGKQFAKSRVTEVLGPHERASILVKPKYNGRVPMGYTSEIVGLKAVDANAASEEPSPEPVVSSAPTVPEFTNTPEPSSPEALAPSAGENENLGPTSSESAALVESAGDYICHAGIDNLPNLRRGSTSQSDVQALQVILEQLGFSPGPLDGQFGRRTEAAVKGFQTANGLTVDGLVGPATWTSLVNSYC